jgi:chorismate-pyruvate lyase
MSHAADAPTAELLYPLSLFRERDGRPLPIVEVIDGAVMPPPYQALLVHHGDMTSRLEAFHGAPMKLRVLNLERSADAYRREVLLCARETGLPVEYGAIEINLTAFEEPLRSEVLEGRLPLGGLLNRAKFKYRSEPRAYLRILPDLTLCRLFDVDVAAAFFGRSNTLLAESGTVLARIVEVLRP